VPAREGDERFVREVGESYDVTARKPVVRGHDKEQLLRHNAFRLRSLADERPCHKRKVDPAVDQLAFESGAITLDESKTFELLKCFWSHLSHY